MSAVRDNIEVATKWVTDFFIELWKVVEPSFPYWFRVLCHLLPFLQDNDMIRYISYCTRPTEETPSDLNGYQDIIEKHSEIKKEDIEKNSILEPTSELFGLVERLLNVTFSSDVSFARDIVWEWEQRRTKNKTLWVEYTKEEIERFETSYNQNEAECKLENISMVLAPTGHTIQFNRENGRHLQKNISTAKTRNVRRRMKIKNTNYLYWLICLKRTESFLKLQKPSEPILILLDKVRSTLYKELEKHKK